MRARQLNLTTLREDPADAEIASHRLLMRAGYLYKSGAGLYLYGHLMKRVIDKIGAIVAEEITDAGGVEVTMPIMQERSLWEASGRWELYQQSKTMLSVTDRGGQEFGLAPTAEEVVTDYAGSQITSYKQMPVCYFQQHTKFRDEIRPRFGLMRVKEFIMMDAYSFHADEASLDETYDAMRVAYLRTFARCGLDAFAVEADSGAIGGAASHEFMVGADVGEDAILLCHESGYAANSERAEGRIAAAPTWSAPAEATVVSTPGAGSIDEVVGFLHENGYADLSAANMLKVVLMTAVSRDAEHQVAFAVRGDRDVEEVKAANAAGRALGVEVLELRPMGDEQVRAATNAAPGYAGPVAGLTVDACIVDQQVPHDQPLVAGANQTDHHVVGLVLERDAAVDLVRDDIIVIRGGDGCPRSDGVLEERRGIEVGHIFQLGTKYSEAMGSEFTGTDGKRHPFVMGCYGIGTSRVAAAAVEQHHDDFGITWPMPIAPYQVVVVPTRFDKDDIREAAETVYQQLRARGVEVILDDRDAKPGVKFKDWDLAGIPIKLVAGRGVGDGQLELKTRAGEQQDVAIDAAADAVVALIEAASAEVTERVQVIQ